MEILGGLPSVLGHVDKFAMANQVLSPQGLRVKLPAPLVEKKIPEICFRSKVTDRERADPCGVADPVEQVNGRIVGPIELVQGFRASQEDIGIPQEGEIIRRPANALVRVFGKLEAPDVILAELDRLTACINELEQESVKALSGQMPAGVEVIIVGDGAFHSTALMSYLTGQE